MDLENVLGELLVDLPADAGVPVVASAREGTWLWPDWICRTPSVLLGWGRPFGSVEGDEPAPPELETPRRIGAGDTVIRMGDVAHPDARRDDRLVLDLAECPSKRVLGPRQSRPRRPGACVELASTKTCRTALCATDFAAGADPHNRC